MLTEMRGWIITICSTLFFITAVEMILPSNSIKKYCKFVLGLILITVIINPFLKFFTGDLNTAALTNSITKNIEGNNPQVTLEKYRAESINNTLNIFKTNLSKSIEGKLLEKFPEYNFKVVVQVSYNNEDTNYILDSLTVSTKDKLKDQVITFLTEELKIKRDTIKILEG